MALQKAIDAAKANGTLCKGCGKLSKERVARLEKQFGQKLIIQENLCACPVKK